MFTEEGGANMFRVFTVVYLLLFLLPAPALANGDLAEILGGIRKNYSDLPGLSLSYSREVITKTMTMLGDQVKGDLATGHMYFKPPYFLKLAQETPKQETVIANEDIIWWHIPDKKQAYKYSAREFGKELRLLSDIFRGLVKVEERFQVTMLDCNDQGEYQIGLIPNPLWQDIDRIILTVSKKNYIRIVGIHYQLGAVTMLTLNDVTPKKDFGKDFFRFVIPEGVKVIEEKG